MIWILRQFFGVISAIWGVIVNIWGAVVSVLRFSYRMLHAVPLYFASMPAWILPIVALGFMIAVGMFVLGRR